MCLLSQGAAMRNCTCLLLKQTCAFVPYFNRSSQESRSSVKMTGHSLEYLEIGPFSPKSLLVGFLKIFVASSISVCFYVVNQGQ